MKPGNKRFFLLKYFSLDHAFAFTANKFWNHKKPLRSHHQHSVHKESAFKTSRPQNPSCIEVAIVIKLWRINVADLNN